jgi:Protein of unknown function (DUF2846)
MGRTRALLAASLVVAASACTSVPMASGRADRAAKTFATEQDMSNLYVYRAASTGPAVNFPVAVDGKVVGELPGATFLMAKVPPGPHTVIVSAENGPAENVIAEPGRNHYLRVSPRMGFLAARAAIDVVTDEHAAQLDISSCRLIFAQP